MSVCAGEWEEVVVMVVCRAAKFGLTSSSCSVCLSLLQCQRLHATTQQVHIVGMRSTMLHLLSTTLNGDSPHDLQSM